MSERELSDAECEKLARKTWDAHFTVSTHSSVTPYDIALIRAGWQARAGEAIAPTGAWATTPKYHDPDDAAPIAQPASPDGQPDARLMEAARDERMRVIPLSAAQPAEPVAQPVAWKCEHCNSDVMLCPPHGFMAVMPGKMWGPMNDGTCPRCGYAAPVDRPQEQNHD